MKEILIVILIVLIIVCYYLKKDKFGSSGYVSSNVNNGWFTTLKNSDGMFQVNMQGDGNLVVCVNVGTPYYFCTWSSGTGGRSDGPFGVYMQGDGNLVIYGKNGFIWDSGTGGRGDGPFNLAMQDDGNLCIYNGSWQAIWCNDSAFSILPLKKLQGLSVLNIQYLPPYYKTFLQSNPAFNHLIASLTNDDILNMTPGKMYEPIANINPTQVLSINNAWVGKVASDKAWADYLALMAQDQS